MLIRLISPAFVSLENSLFDFHLWKNFFYQFRMLIDFFPLSELKKKKSHFISFWWGVLQFLILLFYLQCFFFPPPLTAMKIFLFIFDFCPLATKVLGMCVCVCVCVWVCFYIHLDVLFESFGYVFSWLLLILGGKKFGHYIFNYNLLPICEAEN